MKAIFKSKKRIKELGEVFTPPLLVQEVCNKVPIETWKNPTNKFIDPACGNGNFLIEVIKRKIDNGLSPYQSLMTTYGIDIMPDNVADCRKRMVEVAFEASGEDRSAWKYRLYEKAVAQNIRLGDALKFTPEDIFSLKPSKELKAFRENAINNS